MSCLRSVGINDLVQSWNKLVSNRSSTLFNFAPIVDGDFIRTEPVSAFRSGKFANVPVFFGYAPFLSVLPEACSAPINLYIGPTQMKAQVG